MPFRISLRSITQWPGTELIDEYGGDEYETEAEAEAEIARIMADKAEAMEVFNAASEAQGLDYSLIIEEA